MRVIFFGCAESNRVFRFANALHCNIFSSLVVKQKIPNELRPFSGGGSIRHDRGFAREPKIGGVIGAARHAISGVPVAGTGPNPALTVDPIPVLSIDKIGAEQDANTAPPIGPLQHRPNKPLFR